MNKYLEKIAETNNCQIYAKNIEHYFNAWIPTELKSELWAESYQEPQTKKCFVKIFDKRVHPTKARYVYEITGNGTRKLVSHLTEPKAPRYLGTI